jgi:WD40 repeat protein
VGHTDSIWSAMFSSDGKQVISGSWDHTIRMWDAQTGMAVNKPLTGHSDEANSIAISSDGKHIASGSDDCTSGDKKCSNVGQWRVAR